MNAKSFSSIEGVVLDSNGQPKSDVPVIIQTADQSHPDIAAVTNADGHFRFDGLNPGNYTLAAYSSEGAAISASATTLAGRVHKVIIQAKGPD